ncbi:MAG: NAD/NADP octopine/nopaline dehydrogenase family protein [Clostridia bacterium]|nr:NAD/NADP octopine/nopaline dehydrogenase family protein [Clostridia bacterium]
MKNFSKITVVGGGNIGTQFACQTAAKGYCVTVYTQSPEKYSSQLQIIDNKCNVLCKGSLSNVTDDLSKALDGAEVVFISYPAFMFGAFAEKLQQYIKKGTYIGVLPGTGGAEFAFKKCIEKGAVLFGLQRVPCVARLQEYGKSVRVDGKREKLFLGSIPQVYSFELSKFMSDLFDMPCEPLPNYLNVTMISSNAILHTTRLRSMFSDYTDGMTYSKNPLFYGEWDNKSSNLLLACDDEHQKILEHLKDMDLSYVMSLKQHYESNSVEQMTEKLCSIQSLHNLSSPMIKTEKGWIPDFKSRYFISDFPYGLSIFEGLAEILNVDAPNIKDTMKWYRKITNDNNRFDFGYYGISDITDLYSLYK